MEQQDLFKEIGLAEHPFAFEDKEIVPREFGHLPLALETSKNFIWDSAIFEKDKSQEQRYADFQAKLQELREHYKPFMENHLPLLEEQTEVTSLNQFDFRYLEQGKSYDPYETFTGSWEQVTIPDFRGPAGEDGKWTGHYRTTFALPVFEDTQRIVLNFQSVDYIANIFVNGQYVGSHEGFFAPFSFDITSMLQEENELIIEVKNDIPTLGVGEVLDGDKLYAATGPGWDDPIEGWHHCPPGAGIIGTVTLEKRPLFYIDNIFVRYNAQEEEVELRVGITNYSTKVVRDYKMDIALLPKNYKGKDIGSRTFPVHAIGIGENEYRWRIPITNHKLWEQDTPYLYGALASLTKDGKNISGLTETFGLKTFVSDETTNPKGKFLLNGRPFILRGANEMGHLQQNVMNGDFDQLIDDILIAKICNMNYYRITQRPVQTEIYDYFDMLGMLHQCDFPLFGFLRRNQAEEAIKQAREMEHLVRGHVSTVMTTFINEPMSIRPTTDPNDKYSRRYNLKGHRHLHRDELEAFFKAARQVIYMENPDRVIKNVEGDYDPPTGEGMPDFHTYTMWYTNHGQPIGKLMKGYLPPVKTGWMIGCGEYGAEGLDHEYMMHQRYPKEWMTKNEKGEWYPDRIVRAQTYGSHGDWFHEETTVEDWIKASQDHQSLATTLMTDAFRRRSDILSHTAIHLLIDAWPSGWMKTLVDCNRVPKPAFYAYQDSLEPVRAHLHSNRFNFYPGETVEIEAWVLNDTSNKINATICARVTNHGKPVSPTVLLDASCKEVGSACVGFIPVTIPDSATANSLRVEAGLIDTEGNIYNSEFLPLPVYVPKTGGQATTLGENAAALAKALAVTESSQANTIIVDSTEDVSLNNLVEKYNHVVVLLQQDTTSLTIAGEEVGFVKAPDLFFAATDKAYRHYPLSFLYNKEKGYTDFIATKVVECDSSWKELAYTYTRGDAKPNHGKNTRPFVVQKDIGDTTVTLIGLRTENRVGSNSVLDAYLAEIIF